jgi:opacity protein-like surface antigen
MMKRLKVSVAMCMLLAFCPPAFAEWSADVYLGASFTKSKDAEIRLNGQTVIDAHGRDSSSSGGARLGYWFERAPWLGLALDVSVFTLNLREVDIRVLPISMLLMARAPLLASPDYPHGRLQPYVAAGPSLVFTSLSEFLGAQVPSPAVLEDSSFDPGLDVRAGAGWHLTKPLVLFVEYRFTQVSPTLEDRIPAGRVKFEPTLRTHHMSVGLSYRF